MMFNWSKFRMEQHEDEYYRAHPTLFNVIDVFLDQVFWKFLLSYA